MSANADFSFLFAHILPLSCVRPRSVFVCVCLHLFGVSLIPIYSLLVSFRSHVASLSCVRPAVDAPRSVFVCVCVFIYLVSLLSQYIHFSFLLVHILPLSPVFVRTVVDSAPRSVSVCVSSLFCVSLVPNIFTSRSCVRPVVDTAPRSVFGCVCVKCWVCLC